MCTQFLTLTVFLCSSKLCMSSFNTSDSSYLKHREIRNVTSVHDKKKKNVCGKLSIWLPHLYMKGLKYFLSKGELFFACLNTDVKILP